MSRPEHRPSTSPRRTISIEALIDAHRDLSDAQSQALNARLILLLANHIGDLEVLREALAAARDGLQQSTS